MERIAIAGLSLHDAELDRLELAKQRVVADEKGTAHALTDALAASDLVLLSTCNRLEIAYAREEGHRPCEEDLDAIAGVLGLGEMPAGAEVRQRMHFFRGLTAARHLFRVVCSLDSLVVGEDQILAQVKEAYQRAEAQRLCGQLLGPLFQTALQVGKQVRTETELTQHPVSVVSIAVQQLAKRFGGLAPRVAVIGAGSMGELIGKNLAGVGYPPAVFANRSPERARPLAEPFGAEVLSIEELRGPSTRVDAVLAATSAPGHVLSAAELSAMATRAPLGEGLFACDLAVPRDLEPGVDPAVEIVDLEALREVADDNRALRERAALEAEKLIERKLDVFAKRFAGRVLSDTLAELQAETADILERELAHLNEGSLAGLPADQRKAVERWARTAFGRMAHVPVAALKRFASEAGANGENGANGGNGAGGEDKQGEQPVERVG
jgi:glutamyl-tRNA reductase